MSTRIGFEIALGIILLIVAYFLFAQSNTLSETEISLESAQELGTVIVETANEVSTDAALELADALTIGTQSALEASTREGQIGATATDAAMQAADALSAIESTSTQNADTLSSLQADATEFSNTIATQQSEMLMNAEATASQLQGRLNDNVNVSLTQDAQYEDALRTINEQSTALANLPRIMQDCTDALGCVIIGADDPIVIGSMLTVSGPTAFLGTDSLGGIAIALSQRDNTLLGRDIELVEEDSHCSAEGGQAAAQRIVADESILGVIGTNCSNAGVAALPIISEAGLLMISPTNTSPILTDSNYDEGGVWLPGYFRTAHNDRFQGILTAQFAINELGASSLATIHDGSPYAEGLQEIMADVFEYYGGKVVFRGNINVGDTDMTAILTDIAATGADVIYMPLFEPESGFLVAQAREIGLQDTTLILADGSFVNSFPLNTGDAVIGVYLTAPITSGEAYDSLLVQWDEVIGGVPPSLFHAHAYDATNILLDAIDAVAVETENNFLLIGRQALRDAIANTENYDGISGHLTCLEFPHFMGDCSSGESLAIYQITEDDVHNNIWPPTIVYQPSESLFP